MLRRPAVTIASAIFADQPINQAGPPTRAPPREDLRCAQSAMHHARHPPYQILAASPHSPRLRPTRYGSYAHVKLGAMPKPDVGSTARPYIDPEGTSALPPSWSRTWEHLHRRPIEGLCALCCAGKLEPSNSTHPGCCEKLRRGPHRVPQQHAIATAMLAHVGVGKYGQVSVFKSTGRQGCSPRKPASPRWPRRVNAPSACSLPNGESL